MPPLAIFLLCLFVYITIGCVFSGLLYRRLKDDSLLAASMIVWPIVLLIVFFILIFSLASGKEFR